MPRRILPLRLARGDLGFGRIILTRSHLKGSSTCPKRPTRITQSFLFTLERPSEFDIVSGGCSSSTQKAVDVSRPTFCDLQTPSTGDLHLFKMCDIDPSLDGQDESRRLKVSFRRLRASMNASMWTRLTELELPCANENVVWKATLQTERVC